MELSYQKVRRARGVPRSRLRNGHGQPLVPAAVEEQWLPVDAEFGDEDLTHEDRVIASGMRRYQATFEIAEAAVDQGSASHADAMIEPGKPIGTVPRLGEPLR